MATWRGDRWVSRNGYYQPWDSGLRALAQSSKMENEMMSWARVIASAADRGESKYAAAPITVAVGRRNELRRGAIAYESERAWRDVRDERLKNTARAMGRRK